MSEKLKYGPDCFDYNYYNSNFSEAMRYDSISQQHELKYKFDFIQDFGITYNSILFVGCATGNEPRYFRNNGKDAQGCDISKYAISQADSSISSNIREYDGEKISWQEDNSIDVVCAFDVLTIIPKEQREKLISEMIRVASKLIVIRTTLKVPDDLTDSEFDGIDGYLFKLETLAYWDNIFTENKKLWLKKAKIYSIKHNHREAIIGFERE